MTTIKTSLTVIHNKNDKQQLHRTVEISVNQLLNLIDKKTPNTKPDILYVLAKLKN